MSSTRSRTIRHSPASKSSRIARTRFAAALALTVTIDRAGGVDLTACERVAARLNANLSGLDGEYTLEVESAGLDRPLLRPNDYERFAGKSARIVTSLTVEGGKTHRGVLRGLRGEAAVIATERGELVLPIAAIKTANLGIRSARGSSTRQTATETKAWQR